LSALSDAEVSILPVRTRALVDAFASATNESRFGTSDCRTAAYISDASVRRGMNVREATPDDATAVNGVHLDSVAGLGPAAYDEEQVAAWGTGADPDDYAVDADDNHFVVAEVDGEVRGFGELVFDPGDYLEPPVDAEVKAVYVHPSVARQGVGSALLAELERAARENGVDAVGLWASKNAVPFYEARGYDHVGERAHEFGGEVPGTVVEMRKRF
jgi:putative acetyltransferase